MTIDYVVCLDSFLSWGGPTACWPPATLQPQDQLITHGIFSYVRHPHNLMVVLESLGMSAISLGLHYLSFLFPWVLISFLFFITFLPIVVYRFTVKEEEKLIERFGEEYLEYKRRVPCSYQEDNFEVLA